MHARFRLLTLGGLRVDGPAGELRALRRQERILLAYLARRAPAAVARAELATLLWGDRDEARARHSLRQALFALRRAMGDAIVVTADSVSLSPGSLQLDLDDAILDVRNGRPLGALERWQGDFLAGVDAAAGEALREWIDAERAGVRHLLLAALDAAGAAARAGGDHDAHLAHAARWAEANPWDEDAHVRLALALLDAGRVAESAAALARARELLCEGRGDAPSPRLAALIVDVEARRAAATRQAAPPPEEADATEGVRAAAPVTVPVARSRHVRARIALVAVASVLVVALGVALPGRLGGDAARAGAGDRPLVLAVGSVRATGGGERDSLARALPELLTTRLAWARGVEVVGRARMHELLVRGRGELAAARRAGARELLEGELHALPAGGWRLELRRVDARTGRVRGTFLEESADALDLAHRAASAVLASIGVESPPALPRSEGAVAAGALYEEGLRVVARHGDAREDLRLFTAALARDSTHAMAALQAGLIAATVDEAVPLADGFVRRAEALAHAAPERDRLFIHAYAANFFNDSSALRHARALAARYPLDPAGPMLAGSTLAWGARYAEAIAQLRLALAFDDRDRGDGACAPCAAYGVLLDTYVAADSFAAAERAAREWVAREPSNPVPLERLARVLESLDRAEEARALRHRVAALAPERIPDGLDEARREIHAGDFAAADARLRLLARTPDRARLLDVLWMQVISLRNQGRLREAREAAQRYRALGAEAGWRPRATVIPLAVVLQESGDAAGAAALYDEAWRAHAADERQPRDARDARDARERTWLLTRLATALAEAGDTTRLARLVDSVRATGARSAFGRDPVLHHHARGLLLHARGDDRAAEQAFRAALTSPVMGYTRINLDLARTLVARGAGAEAVPLLRAALRGTSEGSAYYVTRTDLLEALADAFAAAGMRDSAAVHYDRVADALANADAELAGRVARVRARAQALRELSRARDAHGAVTHSARSAVSGSARLARRAGARHAAAPTATSSTATSE